MGKKIVEMEFIVMKKILFIFTTFISYFESNPNLLFLNQSILLKNWKVFCFTNNLNNRGLIFLNFKSFLFLFSYPECMDHFFFCFWREIFKMLKISRLTKRVFTSRNPSQTTQKKIQTELSSASDLLKFFFFFLANNVSKIWNDVISHLWLYTSVYFETKFWIIKKKCWKIKKKWELSKTETNGRNIAKMYKQQSPSPCPFAIIFLCFCLENQFFFLKLFLSKKKN